MASDEGGVEAWVRLNRPLRDNEGALHEHPDSRAEIEIRGTSPDFPGLDRDEYRRMLVAGWARGLERGVNPRGWRADVRYVPSHENRSHGSTMGIKLRRFCNGTRFRYVFY